uniref:Uncharacterized protein n=1 Tax=viral metagenome TaxID=1070528 RepID=A0A6C0JSR6_9ZZZZ
MPTYRFRNKETGEEFEDILSISKKEELLLKNPDIEQLITGCMIVTSIGSLDSKTSDGWKEVLSKVAENHPASPLADRYGRKTIKQNKTRDIVKQHVKKWTNT